MQKIQGGCLCGAVRYRSDAAPLTAICHCKHCQRQTGTAFSLLVAVPKGSLIMEGAHPDTYEDIGDSGLPVLRRFCSKCGSPIFSEVAATPTMDWVKAGTLDDTSWLQPQVNIWCDSAQPWVPISEAIPPPPQSTPGLSFGPWSLICGELRLGLTLLTRRDDRCWKSTKVDVSVGRCAT